MSTTNRTVAVLSTGLLLWGATHSAAQDWPQWRGPHRDASVTGFEAPDTWPEALTQGWKTTVGDGVATPALVGNRLYVFTLQDQNEILRCLDADTGDELWQDKYGAQGADGPAQRYAGPRASPTVAEGKVVTLGVRGTLSCLDAATGKVLWRKNDLDATPRFYTSSSPIVVNGTCIAQLGGESEGAIVAYDLATGDEQWKWSGEGTAYASPVLLEMDGAEVVVAVTTASVVGLGIADGKLLWQTPFAVRGRGYNAATPIVDGQTIILSGSGRGTRAAAIQKEGDAIVASELWANEENSVQFNTPVLKDGLIYGLSDSNVLFCVRTADGETAWTAATSDAAAAEAGRQEGGRRRGRGGGGRGFGSVVDAGPVLLALTPSAQLIVFQPGAEEFQELARYKIADGSTNAYPILAGNRLYVKDQDSVTLWTIGE